jgi:hypothetical protein
MDGPASVRCGVSALRIPSFVGHSPKLRRLGPPRQTHCARVTKPTSIYDTLVNRHQSICACFSCDYPSYTRNSYQQRTLSLSQGSISGLYWANDRRNFVQCSQKTSVPTVGAKSWCDSGQSSGKLKATARYRETFKGCDTPTSARNKTNTAYQAHYQRCQK